MSDLRTLLANLEFSEPTYLLACLSALLIIVLAFLPSGRLVFSSLRLLPAHGHTFRTRLIWLPTALLAAAAILLGVALAGTVQTLGLTQALVQTDDRVREAADGVFWLNLAISFIMAAFLLWLAPVIAGFFSEPRAAAPLRVGCWWPGSRSRWLPGQVWERRWQYHRRPTGEV